jgi:glycolate oxidase FAD binding subunit
MSISENNYCLKPQDLAELQEIVRESKKLVFLGAGTKKALAGIPGGFTCLDLTGWTGITEYQPDEFTITVRAGTPVIAVTEVLKANGQYLPFDPLLVNTGATIGGTVASGLNGSGRYRFGGVCDFLLGVKFINWKGELVSGGGRVVKNAAGFDLPKLMVGSLGMYGCLLELTFKVFPIPKSTITVGASFPTYNQAVAAMVRLSLSPLEIIKLDIEPGLRTYTLWIQLGGAWEDLGQQRIRMSEYIREAATQALTDASEDSLWDITREFLWISPSTTLVKVPLTPKKSAPLEMELAGYGYSRRYSCAGNVLWLGWDSNLESLDSVLTTHNLAGLVIWGPAQRMILGAWEPGEFAQRIKHALDPGGKFSNLAKWQGS